MVHEPNVKTPDEGRSRNALSLNKVVGSSFQSSETAERRLFVWVS